MNIHRFTLIAGLAAAVLVGLGACDSRTSTDAQTSLLKLSVGIQTSPAMALVMVAQDKGFFKSSGVDVQLTQFTAGKFAMQAFLGGSLDVAVTGEVPVTLATLHGNKFRVVGQVVGRTTNEVRVVARKDGSRDAAEYFHAKKRKLATSIGGGPEFYTYNFLKKYGVSSDQVEIISQRPEDMPASLSNGSVDAIAIFDPFAAIAEQKMAEAGITYGDPSLYSELYVINVHDQMLSGAPSAGIRAFLKGLYLAQGYIAQHQDEAKQIVMKYTKLDRSIVDLIWPNYQFTVALNGLFVADTTAEARWTIDKGAVPAGTAVPDYSSVLAPDLLRSVAPDQVTLAR